jgi:hypothetical protein
MIARRELKDELLNLRASAAKGDDRPCTCHPDDNPPRPCPKKYALTDCRRAAKDAVGASDKQLDRLIAFCDPDQWSHSTCGEFAELVLLLYELGELRTAKYLRAAPGEAKCPGCGKRFPSECDWCSEQIPRPDCAPSPEPKCICGEGFGMNLSCPVHSRLLLESYEGFKRHMAQPPSPEQQGAEQRGTCCATDCNNAASEGWYCMAHAEARAAELMAKVTAEDEPDGCDCPHASAARSCGCGFCRALNCTAPAPALGLNKIERDALREVLDWTECACPHVKSAPCPRCIVRSMLERGGR